MSDSTAPPPPQPGTILGIQILLGAVYALEFLQALPGGPVAATASRTTHPLLAFLVFLAVGATAWLMGWAAHMGRNTLRLAFCVTIASLGTLLLASGQLLNLLASAQLLMAVAACVLLYTPPSNAWFALRHAQRTNPALANVLLQAHQQRLHALAHASAATRSDNLLSVCLLLAASAVAAAKLFLPLLSA